LFEIFKSFCPSTKLQKAPQDPAAPAASEGYTPDIHHTTEPEAEHHTSTISPAATSAQA